MPRNSSVAATVFPRTAPPAVDTTRPCPAFVASGWGLRGSDCSSDCGCSVRPWRWCTRPPRSAPRWLRHPRQPGPYALSDRYRSHRRARLVGGQNSLTESNNYDIGRPSGIHAVRVSFGQSCRARERRSGYFERMARPGRTESESVSIWLKLSEADAEKLHQVLARPEFAGWTKAEWCLEIIQTALRYYTKRPVAEPGRSARRRRRRRTLTSRARARTRRPAAQTGRAEAETRHSAAQRAAPKRKPAAPRPEPAAPEPEPVPPEPQRSRAGGAGTGGCGPAVAARGRVPAPGRCPGLPDRHVRGLRRDPVGLSHRKAWMPRSCRWNDMKAAFMPLKRGPRRGIGGHGSGQETLRHHGTAAR